MGRAALLWFLGVPIPVLLLMWSWAGSTSGSTADGLSVARQWRGLTRGSVSSRVRPTRGQVCCCMQTYTA